MQYVSPLTQDEVLRRKRATGEVVEDGEYVGFDLALMRDSAPNRTSVYLTDNDQNSWARNVRDAALAAQLDPAPRTISRQATEAAPTAGVTVDGRAMRDAARASQWG